MNTKQFPALGHSGKGFITVNYVAEMGLFQDCFNLRIGDETRSPEAIDRLIKAAHEMSKIHPAYRVCKPATLRQFLTQTRGNGVLWLNRATAQPLPLP